MSFFPRPTCSALLLALVCAPLAHPQDAARQRLEQQFRAAVALYDAGQFPAAAQQLEPLLHEAPESFDVNELLGMVYGAQSQDAKASPLLLKAVRLKPHSASARTNLAANLVHLGKIDQAGEQFRRAVELEPATYDTNHNLGEFYVQSHKLPEAARYLAEAQKINPASYDNGYDLALSYVLTSRTAEARALIHDLLKRKDTAELHNLLGEVEEKDEKFVEAANEYEVAAHVDPSESNLFDWGSELLIHRTLDPAIEIFRRASERYPNSPRLAIGLGMALYSRGNYDDAVKALLKGTDLDPSDPSCYLFLSKAYDSSPGHADEVIQRFRRFTELQPKNGRALYYYAMSLWKGKRAQDPSVDLGQVEGLLKKSLALDDKLAEAHLQLGNLYSDQSKFADAIPQYVRARELSPDLADVHYRLGQAYVHTGQKEHAQEELQVYQKLRAEHMAEIDKQRADIRQFVYSAKDPAASKQ